MKILLLAPADIRERFSSKKILLRIAKRIGADLDYKPRSIPLDDNRISLLFNELYEPPTDTLLWFDPEPPSDMPWKSTILSANRIVILLRDSQPIPDCCMISLYIEYLAFHHIKTELYFLSEEDLQ